MGIRAMIATDGTELSVAAAERALRYLPADAEILLISITEDLYDPSLDAGGFAGPVMDEEHALQRFNAAQAEGQAAVERVVRHLGNHQVAERVVASSSAVPDAIAAVARDEQVDLIVVGPSQAGWFERHLLGGTDERLLRTAPCPVLVMSGDR
ncbi:MAG: universal stress protein [Actinobacteria bacterium]|nr:universal stress protein [Actinomycetota bacterium]